FLAFRCGRQELRGGPWHEMVMTLARQAGVRVRHVVLLKTRLLNAYASAFGTIGLTSGLISTLEPEEVRAVVAHEIGHLRMRHPQRTLVLSFGTLALILAAEWWLLGRFGSRLSP